MSRTLSPHGSLYFYYTYQPLAQRGLGVLCKIDMHPPNPTWLFDFSTEQFYCLLFFFSVLEYIFFVRLPVNHDTPTSLSAPCSTLFAFFNYLLQNMFFIYIRTNIEHWGRVGQGPPLSPVTYRKRDGSRGYQGIQVFSLGHRARSSPYPYPPPAPPPGGLLKSAQGTLPLPDVYQLHASYHGAV